MNNTWTAEVLNLTRNVKIGGTGNNDADPTGSGRAHLMFLMTNNAQTVKNIELHHMGPRQFSDGRDPTEGVLGRYALHFHHGGEGSVGSLIENVVVRNSGNHAFVPHLSNGVTMRGTISHDTWEDPYWWDGGSANATDNITWENAVASDVHDDPSYRGYRLAGFQLGFGQGNSITGSVAVGVEGNKNSSGFHWPENSVSSPWEFNDNIGHNNKVDGIFTWHNGGTFHLIEDFTMYYNGSYGVSHGAYGNRYTYRNGTLYGNGTAGFALHNVSSGDVISPMLIENMDIDGAGVSQYGIAILKHNTQVSQGYATVLRDNSVTNLASGGKAYAWTYTGLASGPGDPGGEDTGFSGESNHREFFKLINNSYDGSYDDFFYLEGYHNDLDGDGVVDWTDVDGDGDIDYADGGEKYGIIGADGTIITQGADIHVQMPDGEVFQLYSIWEENPSLTDATAWNAKKDEIEASGTPIVDGGGNQSIAQSHALYLDANVIDDGVQNPTGISTWTKVSGPGTVTFDDSSSIDTSATFSTTGEYTLRLTADDGTYSMSDDVRVYVNAANTGTNVTEDFTSNNGDPWPSQWTQQDLGGATTANISNNEGHFASSNGDTNTLMRINTHNAQDVDLTTDFRLTGNSVHAGLFARRSDNDPDTYYGAWTETGANADTQIFKVVDGVLTTILTTGSSVSANTNYTMRFRVTTNEDGTDKLELKVWQAGTTEPTEWTLAVDSTHSVTGITEPALNGVSGRFGILTKMSNRAPRRLRGQL